MVTPINYIEFAIANVIVWPGFALTWWYLFQREDEGVIESIRDRSSESQSSQTAGATESEG
jgi:hypothetical protein